MACQVVSGGPLGPIRATRKFRDLQDWPFGGFRDHLISRFSTENKFGHHLSGLGVNLPKKQLWRIQGSGGLGVQASSALTHHGGPGFHTPGLRAVAHTQCSFPDPLQCMLM